MTRVALAFSLMLAGALFAGQAHAQTASTAPGTQAKPGQTCKKVYVQKKSARTGNYVQVPRTRCS